MDEDVLAPSSDTGEPLAESLRLRLERMLGRSLADVRVHDHAQADRLAGSLGAEGFTVGRHVYLRSGRGTSSTANGSLLAHEATHVAQQTGDTAAIPSGTAPLALASVQRAPAGTALPTEQQAEAIEAAVQRPAAAQAAPVDPEQIAERVYQLMVRDLRLERERGGGNSW